jgi:hypothetical protein
MGEHTRTLGDDCRSSRSRTHGGKGIRTCDGTCHIDGDVLSTAPSGLLRMQRGT